MNHNSLRRTSLLLLLCLIALLAWPGNSAYGQQPQLIVQSGHPDWVVAVCFSPDGQTLASGGSVFDGTIRLWDVATGIQLRVLRGPKSLVADVTFSTDGRRLAGSSGAEIKVWDVATGTEVNTFTGQPDINQISLSDDGTQLVSGSGYRDERQTIKIWDVATGTELKSVRGKDLFNPAVNSLSPDHKTLLQHDADPAHPDVITLTDLATSKEQLVLRGHTDEVMCAAWSADGKLIASGGQDNTIRLWDAATGQELRVFKVTAEVINSIAVSRDGKRLASGNGDSSSGTIKVWDVTSGKGVSTIDAQARGVNTVAFTADGQTVAGLNADGKLRVWDAATGRNLRTLARQTDMDFRISGDGKFLFGLRPKDAQTTISLLDSTTGQEVRKFQGFTTAALSLACSPDGKILAVGGMKTAKLWDIETGQEQHTLAGHPFSVLALAFSGDGKLLATGSGVYGGDGQVRLWDVASGQLLRQVTLPATSIVAALNFSPDNKMLVAGGGIQGHEGVVKLLDVATLTEVRACKGHVDLVRAAAFSSDGKLIISGSWDRTTKVWDAATGAELATLIASGANDWLVVTPDGLFDGSPAAWGQILWRFSPQLRDVAPVELFFNEFYYPNLLADIFAGQRPKATRDIAQRDRRQPQLKLIAPTAAAPIATRNVKVQIQIAPSPAGAQDVRLFRNGLLVKVWPGDVLQGQRGVTLETTLPIVAGANRLTAYAFNHDNIKSADATLLLDGAESLRRKGTAYIVAVGVNLYAPNPFFRSLKYAVADADSFAAEVQSQQERLGQYERVEVVKLADETATKANIIGALTQLAAKVQPEDTVIVYYAGHGLAQGGQFYLIPHDLGNAPPPPVAPQGPALLEAMLHARGISDRELERAFEGVDSGQIMMIIDACNSGQALGGERDGRGPMNSKGLAQLAYDKGMYILTAAQSFQAAQEVSLVGHGLLTFVLLDEGLKRAAADDEPKDGHVMVREWLDYATSRVPQVQLDQMKQAGARGLELSFAEQERGLSMERRSGQRPRVFYRRELEANPLLIATSPPASKENK